MESISDLTRESMRRLRASGDEIMARIRAKMADNPANELPIIGTMIVTNLRSSDIGVAGIAALATFDLALAQGEIVRLQAELDGERAGHAACHRNMLRAAQGRDPQ